MKSLSIFRDLAVKCVCCCEALRLILGGIYRLKDALIFEFRGARFLEGFKFDRLKPQFHPKRKNSDKRTETSFEKSEFYKAYAKK